MKKIRYYSLVILILLLGISCTSTKDETIKIGLILPLTGDAAAWGIPPKNGAELAVHEINAKGGVNGKKVELIIEDAACDASKGISAMNKLVNIDKPVAIVGAVCSSVTLAIAPIAEKNKLVLITPASTNPQITNAGDYIFRVIPSDELRGKVFSEHIYNAGLRKAAVIYINNDGGKGNEQTFTKYFSQLGGEIITSEAYAADATEVKTQLTKIKKSDAEFILAISQIQDAVILLKNAKEMNVALPFYFQTEALEDPKVAELAGDAIKGSTYITFAKEDSPSISEFQKSYSLQYGNNPELFSAESYDAVNLIILSLQMEGTIKENLSKASGYSGASGTISFNVNGDVDKKLVIETF